MWSRSLSLYFYLSVSLHFQHCSLYLDSFFTKLSLYKGKMVPWDSEAPGFLDDRSL